MTGTRVPLSNKWRPLDDCPPFARVLLRDKMTGTVAEGIYDSRTGRTTDGIEPAAWMSPSHHACQCGRREAFYLNGRILCEVCERAESIKSAYEKAHDLGLKWKAAIESMRVPRGVEFSVFVDVSIVRIWCDSRGRAAVANPPQVEPDDMLVRDVMTRAYLELCRKELTEEMKTK